MICRDASGPRTVAGVPSNGPKSEPQSSECFSCIWAFLRNLSLICSSVRPSDLSFAFRALRSSRCLTAVEVGNANCPASQALSCLEAGSTVEASWLASQALSCLSARSTEEALSLLRLSTMTRCADWSVQRPSEAPGSLHQRQAARVHSLCLLEPILQRTDHRSNTKSASAYGLQQRLLVSGRDDRLRGEPRCHQALHGRNCS